MISSAATVRLMNPGGRKARITPEHSTEAARLREYWENRPGHRLSQAEFGERYDVGNQSAVGQFLRGETPLSMNAAKGFVRGLTDAGHKLQLRDISPRLQAMAESIAAVSPSTDSEFVEVPKKTVALSAGKGREPHVEEEVSRLKFRADFLRSVGANRQSAAVVDVSGRSMEPTIPDGAVLLVNGSNREPRDRLIFALRIGNELFVKRLVAHNGGWLARSDNEDRQQYPDIDLSNSTDIEIIGRAVWMGARL